METRYIYGLNEPDVRSAYGKYFYEQAFATVTECLTWRDMQDNPKQYSIFATDGIGVIVLSEGAADEIAAQEAYESAIRCDECGSDRGMVMGDREFRQDAVCCGETMGCYNCDTYGYIVLYREGDWERTVTCDVCNGAGEVEVVA